jgi:hypothetical protein
LPPPPLNDNGQIPTPGPFFVVSVDTDQNSLIGLVLNSGPHFDPDQGEDSYRGRTGTKRFSAAEAFPLPQPLRFFYTRFGLYPDHILHAFEYTEILKYRYFLHVFCLLF